MQPLMFFNICNETQFGKSIYQVNELSYQTLSLTQIWITQTKSSVMKGLSDVSFEILLRLGTFNPKQLCLGMISVFIFDVSICLESIGRTLGSDSF